jgi:hypothetical protein
MLDARVSVAEGSSMLFALQPARLSTSVVSVHPFRSRHDFSSTYERIAIPDVVVLKIEQGVLLTSAKTAKEQQGERKPCSVGCGGTGGDFADLGGKSTPSAPNLSSTLS